MRNLKKIISLVLALMMVLSMMVTASAAFEDQDKIDAKYAEAIEVMAELEILQGDGTNFNPMGTLTRAQAAVILSKVISGKTEVEFFENQTIYTENPFEDVSGWAEPFVLFCLKNGAVQGRNANTYDPNGTLTGYEFAKMMLVAAKIRTQFTSENWKSEVVAAAEKKDENGNYLLNGLTISLNNPITREQASHMALNAMKFGMTVGETTYSVYDGKLELETYDNILDAYMTAMVLGLDPKEAVVRNEPQSVGGILKETFGVDYTANGTDNYGRAATTYTFTNTKNPYKLAFNTAATLKTFSAKATEAEVAKVLGKEYTVAAEVYSDGVYTNNVDTAAKIAALTGPNTVVELYANKDKVVEKIVVVNTKVCEVVIIKATKDTPEMVKIGNLNPVPNTYGLVKGDVVSYTVYEDYLNGVTKLDNVTKLEGTEAALSGLNSYGYYTINGQYYTLDLADKLDADTIKNTLKDGSKLIYYFGANNTVVYFQIPGVETPETPAVVYNNFAYVLDAAFIQTGVNVSAGSALNPGKASATYGGAAELLLADGKVVEVAITIEKAAEAIKVAGETVVPQGKYYYTVGNHYVVVENIDKATTTVNAPLTALKGKVVAYDDGVISYAPTTLAPKTSGNIYAVTKDTVYVTSPVINGEILVNSNTTFVVNTLDKNGKLSDKYTSVKGQANLGDYGVKAEYVVYAATYDAKANDGKGAYTYTALVVFAHNDTIGFEDKTEEVKPVDYVMYTGYTTTEWDAKANAGKGDWVNVHSMMKADGTYVTVKLPEYVTLYNVVIYVLNSDGTIDYDVEDTIKTNGEITLVSESFIKVDQYVDGETTKEAWLMTNAKTTVYGELVVGNYAFWVDSNNDGYVEAMFVFTQD